jgi:serine phosphatase RsbU (regulator of sigma subunit)
MIQHPQDRDTLLVSPGYPFLHILIAVSVLHIDWRVTALTGLISGFGYAGLAAFALTREGINRLSPHPPALYVVLTGMLVVSATASVFVAAQFRSYLRAAAREMETRGQRDRLQHDLEIAHVIQQQLLPRHIPELTGYQIAAVNLPADETGGDYYDWEPLRPLRVVFSLGDVTGHGIGPALVTSACRAYVRGLLAGNPPFEGILQKVNRLLSRDLPEGRFVTLVLAALNAATHEALVLSAGHGPTLHVRGDNGTVRRIGSQGLPLGLQEEQSWDHPVRLCLGPGDLLVLLSDGFFEPANPAGEPFGLDRLEQVIRECRRQPADRVVAAMESAVRHFLNGASQPDDMTAVVIKRTTT